MDQNLYTVHFNVRCEGIKDWEKVYVVGNLPILGSWQPKQSFPLTCSEEDRELWCGSIPVPDRKQHVQFRYLRVYHLDPADNDFAEPHFCLSKWETLFAPRQCLVNCEASNGIARKNTVHRFGEYDGKVQISDGWILNNLESVVYFRIHGEALKFYKKHFTTQEHRLKIVPFDVRFREMFSYKHEGLNSRRAIWRHSSVYTSISKDLEDEMDSTPYLPDLPSFSDTDLSVITRDDPIFGDQYVNGSVFRNNIDYLVFRTRTVSIQNLGFRIELYNDMKRIAIAYALPSTFPDTHGTAIFPFVGMNNVPVGQLHVDYMITKRNPAAENLPAIDSMEFSFGRYWRKRKRMLEIGHRGMGSSYTKSTSARENTILSLNQAAKRGADYVELDVQLTKDLQTVVYHDFHVLVTVAGRDSPAGTPTAAGENFALHEIAIKDITLSQLKLLHCEHISKADIKSEKEKTLSVTPGKDETDEMHVPFPSLAQVLTMVDENVGLNIEIKYPMYMKDGSHECHGYFEQNKFVDRILSEVAEHAGNRRIVFSCFEPDICTLITKKQHRYPVLFLVVGATNRYMPFKDIRSDCSRIAANFAAGCELLGVNFHSEELLNDQTPITIADRYGLVKFVWGDDLNSKDIQAKFKNEMNVDGLIFDRIGEDETAKQNVFIVENEHRSSLFVKYNKDHSSRSPSMSRRCMSMAE